MASGPNRTQGRRISTYLPASTLVSFELPSSPIPNQSSPMLQGYRSQNQPSPFPQTRHFHSQSPPLLNMQANTMLPLSQPAGLQNQVMSASPNDTHAFAQTETTLPQQLVHSRLMENSMVPQFSNPVRSLHQSALNRPPAPISPYRYALTTPVPMLNSYRLMSSNLTAAQTVLKGFSPQKQTFSEGMIPVRIPVQIPVDIGTLDYSKLPGVSTGFSSQPSLPATSPGASKFPFMPQSSEQNPDMKSSKDNEAKKKALDSVRGKNALDFVREMLQLQPPSVNDIQQHQGAQGNAEVASRMSFSPSTSIDITEEQKWKQLQKNRQIQKAASRKSGDVQGAKEPLDLSQSASTSDSSAGCAARLQPYGELDQGSADLAARHQPYSGENQALTELAARPQLYYGEYQPYRHSQLMNRQENVYQPTQVAVGQTGSSPEEINMLASIFFPGSEDTDAPTGSVHEQQSKAEQELLGSESSASKRPGEHASSETNLPSLTTISGSSSNYQQQIARWQLNKERPDVFNERPSGSSIAQQSRSNVLSGTRNIHQYQYHIAQCPDVQSEHLSNERSSYPYQSRYSGLQIESGYSVITSNMQQQQNQLQQISRRHLVNERPSPSYQYMQNNSQETTLHSAASNQQSQSYQNFRSDQLVQHYRSFQDDSKISTPKEDLQQTMHNERRVLSGLTLRSRDTLQSPLSVMPSFAQQQRLVSNPDLQSRHFATDRLTESHSDCTSDRPYRLFQSQERATSQAAGTPPQATPDIQTPQQQYDLEQDASAYTANQPSLALAMVRPMLAENCNRLGVNRMPTGYNKLQAAVSNSQWMESSFSNSARMKDSFSRTSISGHDLGQINLYVQAPLQGDDESFDPELLLNTEMHRRLSPGGVPFTPQPQEDGLGRSNFSREVGGPVWSSRETRSRQAFREQEQQEPAARLETHVTDQPQGSPSNQPAMHVLPELREVTEEFFGSLVSPPGPEVEAEAVPSARADAAEAGLPNKETSSGSPRPQLDLETEQEAWSPSYDDYPTLQASVERGADGEASSLLPQQPMGKRSPKKKAKISEEQEEDAVTSTTTDDENDPDSHVDKSCSG